jgi:RHS repeat-associated protein
MGAINKADGSVWTWGFKYTGGPQQFNTSPVQEVGPGGSGVLTGIVQLVITDSVYIALRNDGTVWAWGDNSNGEVGNGAILINNPNLAVLTPTQVVGVGGSGFLNGVVALAGGGSHVLALKSNGTVVGWGTDGFGELGNNDPLGSSSSVPVQVVGQGGSGMLTNIVGIAAGYRYSLAVASTGNVLSWGQNQQGELGIGTTDSNAHRTPVNVMGAGGSGVLGGVTQIAAGYYSAVARKFDGSAWTWGSGSFGELGNGDTTLNNSFTPTQVMDPGGGPIANVALVQAGSGYDAALKNNGSVWTWGQNNYGQLGVGTSDLSSHVLPAQVIGVGGSGFLTAAQGGSCFPKRTPQCLTSPILIGNFGAYTNAVKVDHSLVSWGINTYGELGDGTTTNSSTPVPVAGVGGSGTLGGVVSVASGSITSVALLQNGTVVSWGRGPLGDGTGNSSLTPVRVVSPDGTGQLTGIIAVAEGDSTSYALGQDGTVWSWGDNGHGQLGIGTSTGGSLFPVHVVAPSGTGNLDGIVEVAAGTGQVLALKSNGTVFAWGDGGGDLGTADSTAVNVGTPTQVVGPGGNGFFADAVDIAGGQYYSMALRSDGTVWSWGRNNGGVLGTGHSDSQTYPLPTEVLGRNGSGYLTGIVQISATEEHSAALTAEGAVLTWGQNNLGELGNGDQGMFPSATPVPVVDPGGGLLGNVSRVAGGEFFGAALKENGTVVTWGSNQFNQLGNGSTADVNAHSVPGQVVGPGGTGFLSGIAQPLPCAQPTAPPPPPPPPPGPTQEATTGGGSPSTTPTTPQCGSYPINCLTGEFWHRFEDIKILGRGPSLDLTRTYSSSNTARNGPLGYGWTHSYNMSLSIDQTTGNATVYEEGGSTLTFTSTGTGYQPRSWVFATLIRNPDGTWKLTRKDQRQHIFDSNGRLTREVDRNGYTTTLTYDSGGTLTTVADPAVRSLGLGYDTNGHLVTMVDPLGRKVGYLYDANGNLASVTNVGGGVTGFTYDGNHRILTMTDPNGGVLTNTYDSSGRVISQKDPMGRVTQYAYGSGSTTITHPTGDLTLEQFQNNELVGLTKAPGTSQAATWTFAYDQNNLCVISATDPNNFTWKRTCDASGNLSNMTDPLNRTTTFSYDALNDVTSIKDPLGNATQLTYDSSGNLMKSSRPAGGTTQQLVAYSLDPTHPGDVTAVTDANGKVWQIAYDQYGDPVKVIDPLGNATTYTYDAGGRLLSTVSPNGNVAGGTPATYRTAYSYNAFNDPLTTVDPLGRRTATQYDGNRNPTIVTDATGGTTKTTYDADNEPVSMVRPDGGSATMSYDGDGALIGQKDGLGNLTSYGYDALHRLTSTTDPLNRKAAVAYDGAGRRTSLTDAMNRVTSFTYDAANQLTGMGFSDGRTPRVAFVYDANGRRTSMTDGTGTSSYSYDALGRLTQTVDGNGRTVGYSYDLNSNLTTLQYPDGSQVLRLYDGANRLTSVSDWLGHKTSFGYDANGNLTKQSYPNAVTASLTYDGADQLSGITDAGPMGALSFTYGFNKLGGLTSEKVVGEPPNGPITYGYDGLNRLTSDNFGAFQQTFQYDAADRLTQTAVTDSKGTQMSTLTYDGASQLLNLTQVQGSKLLKRWQFSYDAVGDRLQRSDQLGAVTSYGYDQAGRLINYGGNSTYSYNGDGLRMSKTVSGVAEPFIWDMADGMPVIIQDGTTRYLTGINGLPLEQIAADGTVRYYHQDQLGSTRAITNSLGKLDATALYDPYGNLEASSGSVNNPFGFAGQYTDAESGLQYMRGRYYDPSTASFITRDPNMGFSGRGYSYAKDSPLNYVDPTGYWPSINALWNFLWNGAEALSVVTLFAGALFEFVVRIPPLEAVFNALSVGFSALSAMKSAMGGNIVKAIFELGGSLLGTFKYLIPSLGRLLPTLASFVRDWSVSNLIAGAWASVKELFNISGVITSLEKLSDLAGAISGDLGHIFDVIAVGLSGIELAFNAWFPEPSAPPAQTSPAQPAPC